LIAWAKNSVCDDFARQQRAGQVRGNLQRRFEEADQTAARLIAQFRKATQPEYCCGLVDGAGVPPRGVP